MSSDANLHASGNPGPPGLPAPQALSPRILYLCSREIYESKMSRVRFHAVAALASRCEMRLTGNGWEGYQSEETVRENVARLYGGGFPDAVLAYKPMEHREFREVPCLKVITYNEMWDVEGTTREIVDSGADLIVAHHRNDIERYAHLRDTRFVNISHCAETSIFRDYGLDKDVDVLLVGALDDYHYPFRARLKALVEEHLAQSLRCHVLPHPGYDLRAIQGPVLADYARQINRAKIAVTCSSRWKYRLAKYVEIPMCASLLAADLPDEDQDFFRQFMLVLDPADADRDILDKLAHYARDDEARRRRVRAGLTASREYTQEHYALRLLDAVREALKVRGRSGAAPGREAPGPAANAPDLDSPEDQRSEPWQHESQ